MFELNDARMFMYFGCKQGVGQATLLTGSVLLPRKIEISKLQDAANELFRINSGLRAEFVEKDEKVYQDTKPFVRREFEVLHFNSREEFDEYGEVYGTIPLPLPVRVEGSGVSKERWKSEKPSAILVKNIVIHEIKMYFTKRRLGKLKTEPTVCEFTLVDLPDYSGALIKMNHIVSDAWTVLLIANQFLSLLKGETVQSFEFVDFMEKEKKYYASSRYERDRKYMASEYAKCPEQTWLWPQGYTSLEAKRKTTLLDKELTAKINECAERNGTTPYVLFLSAVAMYAYKKLRRDKFYICSVALNRTSYSEKNTVGMFVTGIPVLMEIEPGDTYRQLMNMVSDKSLKGFRHYKGKEPVVDSKKMKYDIWVSYQNAKLEADPTAIINQYYCRYAVDTAIISIEDRLSDGQYRLIFDYNIKISDEEVDDLFASVIKTLRQIVDDPDQPIE